MMVLVRRRAVAENRASIWSGLANIVAVVRSWRDRAEQRRQLARLSDAALKDIGLSRTDAWAEYTKSFWRS